MLDDHVRAGGGTSQDSTTARLPAAQSDFFPERGWFHLVSPRAPFLFWLLRLTRGYAVIECLRRKSKGQPLSAAPFPGSKYDTLRKQLNAGNAEHIGLRIKTAGYPDLLAFEQFRFVLVVDLI